MKSILFILLFLSIPYNELLAQKKILQPYKWNNRIVILTNKPHDQVRSEKLSKTILNYKQELIERKIIFFEVVEHKFRTFKYSNNNYAPSKWKESPILYKAFDDKNKRVFLVGLDGGIKYKSEKLNLIEIIKLIDTMPMRRSEIKFKN